MKIKSKNNDIILSDISCFNVGLSVDCGQAFRWTKKEDGSFHGVIFKRGVDIIQNGNEIVFKNTDEKTFNEVFVPYFDLNRDYEKICSGFDDRYLKEACKEYPGIRILRQEPWETLCSFIISQNNNIPRIKGIIERLCASFGDDLGNGDFSFPSAEVVSKLSETDLAPLRAGFRNKYILDAAAKCFSGEVSLEKIKTMPIEEARQELMKIKGVGPKVAECTLLYGFGKIEAFPIDVWVKRILSELYEDGLPKCTKGVEGIAQQYLFHWRRNLENK
ncbi:MAG: DNA glycosylase [Clostridia bacterium]|nr:DNA glycosylase [Clostridia bacterium]